MDNFVGNPSDFASSDEFDDLIFAALRNDEKEEIMEASMKVEKPQSLEKRLAKLENNKNNQYNHLIAVLCENGIGHMIEVTDSAIKVTINETFYFDDYGSII